MSTYASDQEVRSNIEAYAESPWGEVLDFADTKQFLDNFYTQPDHFVLKFSQEKDLPAYIFIHCINYGQKVDELIKNEFTGGDAYYQAKDPKLIQEALSGLGSAIYIANVHADRKAPISPNMKPRMKLFESTLYKMLERTQAVVLMTHRMTGVYRSLAKLDPSGLNVKTTSYRLNRKPKVKFNQNHNIDHLELVVITSAS